MFSTVIKAGTLYELINSKSPLVLLDSSYNFYSDFNKQKAKFAEERIPGAKYFDFEKISEKSAHLMPNTEKMKEYLKNLNVKKDNTLVVIYDRNEAKTAARLWFMLKVFGKSNLAVLDGGIEKWKSLGYQLENTSEHSKKEPENFEINESKNNEENFNFFKDNSKLKDYSYVAAMSDLLSKKNPQTLTRIIDARSPLRFLGIGSEPNPKIPSGNIPGSKNLYNNYCLNNDFTYKSKEELLELFVKYNLDLTDDEKIIHTSGIGNSACANILAMEIAGFTNNILYDGGWAD